MPNTLSAYNPVFYATEAQMALEKALGMASRVYRGFDDEQSSRMYGDTITMRVPGAFSAQNAPSSEQDVTASSISMNLNQWKEVKFALTDRELAYSSQRIIEEHIRPAAYALADQIDQSLAALWQDVPYVVDASAPMVVGDITSVRRTMFNNRVPLNDPAALSFMVDGTGEKELLDIAAFTQNQGAGNTGIESQISGFLGRRYGFNFFANQNVQSATSATVADLAGAVNNGAGYAAGIRTMAIDGLSAAAALKKGDILVVTGHAQQYVLTADATADGAGAIASVSFFGSPNVRSGGLEAAVADNQVVTVILSGTSGATRAQNLAFHRNAFALGVARLPDFMDGQGVRAFSTPVDGSSLSVRARTWADGNNSQFFVALDVLYGIQTLDGNKAVRFRD
jgi:hypothetical protein